MKKDGVPIMNLNKEAVKMYFEGKYEVALEIFEKQVREEGNITNK